MNRINGDTPPTHMAIDAITFQAAMKVLSKMPWDEVNSIMAGLVQATPVDLKEAQTVK